MVAKATAVRIQAKIQTVARQLIMNQVVVDILSYSRQRRTQKTERRGGATVHPYRCAESRVHTSQWQVWPPFTVDRNVI
jgi:hypothetical protein